MSRAIARDVLSRAITRDNKSRAIAGDVYNIDSGELFVLFNGYTFQFQGDR